MSTENEHETEDVPEESQGASQETAPTFKEQVQAVVGKMVVDDNGISKLPTGLEASEEVIYAATIEKRQRDSRSAFLQKAQEVAALKAERDELQQRVVQANPIDLSAAQAAQLDELKLEDPDKWRTTINALEQDNKTELKKDLDKITKATETASAAEVRAELYKHFKQDTGMELTDEMVDNDLPAAYKAGLESGDLSFEQFLTKAAVFLARDASIKPTEDATQQPNLGNARGSHDPSAVAQQVDSDEAYKNEIY